MNLFLRKIANLAFLGLLAVPAFAQDELSPDLLGHVERILVVDSINVPKDGFFSRYRLQPSAGRILTGREIASQLRDTHFADDFRGAPLTGFTNEFNDYLIWAQEDTTGYFRLAESVRLVDGSWSAPQFTPAVLNTGSDEPDAPIEANAAFPFMLDDGQTLYYAADNEDSIGGYDIFIATKDPSDGQFLIPGNLGLPFNSPYNDYMMVLDRQTGVGWWATDRNQLENELTVYVYALTDDRVNADPDDENILSYATLSGWQQLQDDDQRAEAARLRREIAAISKPDVRVPEFELPMPGGKTYRFYSDFKNPASQRLMKQYLKDKAALELKEKQLADLRAKFHNSPSGNNRNQLSTQIRQLEEQVRASGKALRSQLSQIYKSES